MTIETDYLKRCIEALKRAFGALRELEAAGESDNVLYDVYRAACVKEFELVLDQSGKLLKKRLRPWFASNRHADRLTFKDTFRHANKHCLIGTDARERWFRYRDNRNRHGSRLRRGFRRGYAQAVAGLPRRRGGARRRDRPERPMKFEPGYSVDRQRTERRDRGASICCLRYRDASSRLVERDALSDWLPPCRSHRQYRQPREAARKVTIGSVSWSLDLRTTGDLEPASSNRLDSRSE